MQPQENRKSTLKNICSTGSFLGLFLGLGASFFGAGTPASAAQPLVDPVERLAAYRALGTADVKTLTRFVAIHYDYYLARPWTPEEYRKEYQSRSQAFAAVYCPQVTELCGALQKQEQELQAIEGAIPPESIQEVAKVFATSSTVLAVNAKLMAGGSPVQISFPLQVPGLVLQDLDAGDFNFVVGVFESAMGALSVTHVKLSVLDDIASYYLTYIQRPVPKYFAIDTRQTLYIFNEPVEDAAIAIAKTWQSTVGAPLKTSMFETPKLLLQKLSQETAADLSEFADLTPVQAKEWVSYGELARLVRAQALAYRKAQAKGKDVDVREVLLQMQAAAKTSMWNYLASTHSLYEGAPLLEQLGGRVIINTVILENLSVLLRHGPYKKTAVAGGEWMATVDWSALIDASVIANSHPELHQSLLSKNLYAKAAWHTWTPSERQMVLEQLLYPKSLAAQTLDTSEISPAGFQIVSAAMALGRPVVEQVATANEIHRTRYAAPMGPMARRSSP